MDKARLTYPTARRLLKEAVKENPDKVAVPSYTALDFNSNNVTKRVPMCIVGTVLFKAGVPIEQIAPLDSFGDCALENIWDFDEFPVSLTDKAYSLLWRAQQEQDSGAPWGELPELLEQ